MSAAFHEVQFPTLISAGAAGGPGFNTTVTTLSSGAENRNINWSLARATFDVAQGLKSQRDLDALIKFFMARRGKAYGFRYKDWSDYQLPWWTDTPGDIDALPLLFTTDGTTAAFQLVKVYGDGAGSYTRTITKPVAGTLALLNNGTPTTDFTLDTTTGIVTLGGTTASTTGHLITGSCEFDVPVRFDVDEMKVTINEYDINTWGAITLVEVREI